MPTEHGSLAWRWTSSTVPTTFALRPSPLTPQRAQRRTRPSTSDPRRPGASSTDSGSSSGDIPPPPWMTSLLEQPATRGEARAPSNRSLWLEEAVTKSSDTYRSSALTNTDSLDRGCPVSSGPGARSALTRMAVRPREREPGALAARRGSGRQQAHRRLPQSRQRRAAGVADHNAGPSKAWRCAPSANLRSPT